MERTALEDERHSRFWQIRLDLRIPAMIPIRASPERQIILLVMGRGPERGVLRLSCSQAGFSFMMPFPPEMLATHCLAER